MADKYDVSPLISILSHLHQSGSYPSSVRFLYSTKYTSEPLDSILFFPRISKIFSQVDRHSNCLSLYRTGAHHHPPLPPASEDEGRLKSAVDFTRPDQGTQYPMQRDLKANTKLNIREFCHRISEHDLLEALGPEADRDRIVVYACGPPSLTEWAVDTANAARGIVEGQVLCEKWW